MDKQFKIYLDYNAGYKYFMVYEKPLPETGDNWGDCEVYEVKEVMATNYDNGDAMDYHFFVVTHGYDDMGKDEYFHDYIAIKREIQEWKVRNYQTNSEVFVWLSTFNRLIDSSINIRIDLDGSSFEDYEEFENYLIEKIATTTGVAEVPEVLISDIMIGYSHLVA